MHTILTACACNNVFAQRDDGLRVNTGIYLRVVYGQVSDMFFFVCRPAAHLSCTFLCIDLNVCPSLQPLTAIVSIPVGTSKA